MRSAPPFSQNQMASPWVAARQPVMSLDGALGVSQHIEGEGCALEGGAIWPGLLEPSYLRGPSYSTLSRHSVAPAQPVGCGHGNGTGGRRTEMSP